MADIDNHTKIPRWRIIVGIILFIILLLVAWYVRARTHHTILPSATGLRTGHPIVNHSTGDIASRTLTR